MGFTNHHWRHGIDFVCIAAPIVNKPLGLLGSRHWDIWILLPTNIIRYREVVQWRLALYIAANQFQHNQKRRGSMRPSIV